jgi:hypothetical protein
MSFVEGEEIFFATLKLISEELGSRDMIPLRILEIFFGTLKILSNTLEHLRGV